MVFQNYALFPHMTVRKNIGFGLDMRGLAKAEIARKVDEALSPSSASAARATNCPASSPAASSSASPSRAPSSSSRRWC